MLLRIAVLVGIFVGCGLVEKCCAFQKVSEEQQALDISQHGFDGVSMAVRTGSQIRFTPTKRGRAQRYIVSPRFCAAIAAVECIGHPEIKVKVQPEPTLWRLQWSEALPDGADLLMRFDMPPRLISEQIAIKPSSDGALFLRACEARTVGEKLRYEPQPFKNTVGFWIEQSDAAVWQCQIQEAGWYSVAILQGCGHGQGGSQGNIIFFKKGSKIDSATCVIKETGHFQNFEWVHGGHVFLGEVGDYTVHIQPEHIRGKAFGDIRAVSIVRQQKHVAAGNQ
jgi:hypothetical protein